MHESHKAGEIETKIKAAAKKKRIRRIKKLILKTGSSIGESKEDLEHIIDNKLKLKNYEVIDGEVVMVCSSCRKIPKDESRILGCAHCGSIKFDVFQSSGMEIIGLE
jgi:Zn finger protein HypA/HybF involved in hydrogenase expression